MAGISSKCESGPSIAMDTVTVRQYGPRALPTLPILDPDPPALFVPSFMFVPLLSYQIRSENIEVWKARIRLNTIFREVNCGVKKVGREQNKEEEEQVARRDRESSERETNSSTCSIGGR